MKRARSSRAELLVQSNCGGSRHSRWQAKERRSVLFFLLIVCPLLYSALHGLLLLRGGGARPTARPVPPSSLCAGQEAAGWPLLDSLHQLRYERAVLEAERDRLLLPTAPAAHPQQWQAGGAPLPVFLFIGAFSAAPNRGMRDAARDAWLTPANARPDVVARFFVAAADREEADAVRAEARQYGDIALLGDEEEDAPAAQQTTQQEPTPAAAAAAPENGEAVGASAAVAERKGSRRLAVRSEGGSRRNATQPGGRTRGSGAPPQPQHRIYSMLQHALDAHAGAAFVMKTEDSAFLNVPALVQELKANCRNPGCRMERMYFGREVRPVASTPPAKDIKSGKKGGGGGKGGSIADAASAANDADWSAHTSLQEYVPFMLGGGFVLSSDLAEVILRVNTQEGGRLEGGSFLKFLSSEEISVGVWLMSVDLRRINHPGVLSVPLGQDASVDQGCCFEAPAGSRRGAKGGADKGGGGTAQPAVLRPTVDVCDGEGYLVLHPIMAEEEMRYLGARLGQCRAQGQLEDAGRALAVGLSQRLAAEVDGILLPEADAEAQPSAAWPAPGQVLRLGSEEGGKSGAAGGVASGGAVPPQLLLAAAAGGGWSPDGEALLALALPEGEEALAPSDRLQLGVLTRGSSGSSQGSQWGWQSLELVSAWGPARGPHAQWLGPTRRFVIFNDRQCNGSAHSVAGASSNSSSRPSAGVPAATTGAGPTGPGATAQQARPGGATCAVLYDLRRMTRTRVLPRPVYALSPDGITAATLSFARLAAAAEGEGHGAGRGDAAGAAPLQPCPEDDGLWLMDTPSGDARLLAPLAGLAAAVAAARGPAPPAPSCLHWVDEPVFGPADDFLAFFYRVGRCGSSGAAAAAQPGLQTHLFIARHSGRSSGIGGAHGVWYVPLPFLGPAAVSFSRAGASLLVCGGSAVFEVPLRLEGEGDGYPVANITRVEVPAAAALEGSLLRCSYDPASDRRVLLVAEGNEGGVSGPGAAAPRSLMLWDRWSGAVEGIGRYTPSAEGRRGLAPHAGLAPAWSWDGGGVAFASSHSGQGWQVYLAGVAPSAAAAPPAAKLEAGQASGGKAGVRARRRGRRRIYLDLGSGRGGSVTAFLGSRPEGGNYEVHAFEPDPNLTPALKAALAKAGKQVAKGVPPPRLHRAAAWTSDGQVTLHAGAPGGSGSSGVGGILRSLWQPAHEYRGGSMFGPSGDLPSAGANASGVVGPGAEALTVPAMDFSAWLQRQVALDDYVVLRMDVAGAEFDLLPRLLRDGALELVDELEVLWGDGQYRQQYTQWPEAYQRLLAAAGLALGDRGAPDGKT